MSKAKLKKIFLEYLTSEDYKAKNGKSWDEYMPLFCEPYLTDEERWEVWNNLQNSKKNKAA